MIFSLGSKIMKYYDEKVGRERMTLEHFLKPEEENREDVLHLLDKCKHEWIHCLHQELNSQGDQQSCQKISRYKTYGHYVCRFCGKEKYPHSAWGNSVSKILEQRRDEWEKSQIEKE